MSRTFSGPFAQALREAGYAVDEAPDGREGLYKASGADYDAIVLDLMLPKLDGLGFLSCANCANRRSVPVPTFLRERLRRAGRSRERTRRAGRMTISSSPLRGWRNSLALIAGADFADRRERPAPAITIGEVIVDTAGARASVTAATGSPPDGARVFPGRIIGAAIAANWSTRSMIYEHLFDEDDDSLSNLVDVHVSNVRRKLGKDFITTRRGARIT